MLRKWMGVLFLAALVLGLTIPAGAAEMTGSIRISLDVGELPVTNGAIALFPVGSPCEDGFLLRESFGGGIVKETDAQSPSLARWLTESAGEDGKLVYLDVDGNVTFSNLDQGLYLLVQVEQMDGFHKLNPFLVAVPEGDAWDVRLDLVPNPIIFTEENPKTGQQPAPLIAAMVLVASGVGLYLCVDTKRRK